MRSKYVRTQLFLFCPAPAVRECLVGPAANCSAPLRRVGAHSCISPPKAEARTEAGVRARDHASSGIKKKRAERIRDRSGNGSGGESRPGEEGPKPRGSQAGPKPRARRVGLIRLVHGSEGKGATHVDRRSQQKLRYVTLVRRSASEPSGAGLSQIVHSHVFFGARQVSC